MKNLPKIDPRIDYVSVEEVFSRDCQDGCGFPHEPFEDGHILVITQGSKPLYVVVPYTTYMDIQKEG